MSEMVERVARAVHKDTGSSMSWDDCHPEYRRIKINEARAAITAMREPTLAMAEAPYKFADEIPKTDPPMWARAYQLMIDAALDQRELEAIEA